jgi:biotin synthase
MYSIKEIVQMLSFRGNDQKNLFDAARAKRDEVFGPKVVLRGVIEVSNLCRVNCDYCPMRRDNTKENFIFTLTHQQLVETAEKIKDNDLNVVFLQAGEIPQTTTVVNEAIPKIKNIFDGQVEVLLCLGNKTEQEYYSMKKNGADSYILKFETSNPSLHYKLRYESLETRLFHLKTLLKLGYRVGTGTIVGLPGQSLEDLAKDIALATELDTHMASASPFIPAPNTPLSSYSSGSLDITLNTMAIMRLMSPKYLIPSVSALEKLEQGGQMKGLMVGANVLTINFTPEIQKNKYLIYGKERYVVKKEYVENLLKATGLSSAKSTLYSD